MFLLCFAVLHALSFWRRVIFLLSIDLPCSVRSLVRGILFCIEFLGQSGPGPASKCTFVPGPQIITPLAIPWMPLEPMFMMSTPRTRVRRVYPLRLTIQNVFRVPSSRKKCVHARAWLKTSKQVSGGFAHTGKAARNPPVIFSIVFDLRIASWCMSLRVHMAL